MRTSTSRLLTLGTFAFVGVLAPGCKTPVVDVDACRVAEDYVNKTWTEGHGQNGRATVSNFSCDDFSANGQAGCGRGKLIFPDHTPKGNDLRIPGLKHRGFPVRVVEPCGMLHVHLHTSSRSSKHLLFQGRRGQARKLSRH